MNDINRLLDKYFAGETSREDDLQLRQYFSEAEVDDELNDLKPLFSYLDEEANVFEFLRDLRSETELRLATELRLESELKSVTELKLESDPSSEGDLKSESESRSERKVVLFPKVLKIATVAACFLIGIFLLNRYNSRGSELSQNIVWIDGVENNDIYVVRAHAETSFSKVITEENIMEEQLNMMLK